MGLVYCIDVHVLSQVVNNIRPCTSNLGLLGLIEKLTLLMNRGSLTSLKPHNAID